MRVTVPPDQLAELVGRSRSPLHLTATDGGQPVADNKRAKAKEMRSGLSTAGLMKRRVWLHGFFILFLVCLSVYDVQIR